MWCLFHFLTSLNTPERAGRRRSDERSMPADDSEWRWRLAEGKGRTDVGQHDISMQRVDAVVDVRRSGFVPACLRRCEVEPG